MRIETPLPAGLSATPSNYTPSSYTPFSFTPPPAPSAQRLTLSPEAMAAAGGKEATPQQVQLVRTLLYALSGCDPEEFTIFYMRAQAQPAQAADLSAHGEQLQRIMMGTVREAGSRVLACSVTLRFMPQLLASEWGLNLATPEADGGAMPFTVDSDAPLAQLIGQQLRFECMADARGLWPLQAQLLSGVVRFGSNVAGQVRKPKPETHAAAEGETSEEAPADAPAAAVDDGGPPRISASRWMELKTFGWIGGLVERVGGWFR